MDTAYIWLYTTIHGGHTLIYPWVLDLTPFHRTISGVRDCFSYRSCRTLAILRKQSETTQWFLYREILKVICECLGKGSNLFFVFQGKVRSEIYWIEIKNIFKLSLMRNRWFSYYYSKVVNLITVTRHVQACFAKNDFHCSPYSFWYMCVCVQNYSACLFEMLLVQGLTINRGNRNRQVQQLLQAGTLTQDNVVLVNKAIWVSFQVCCAVLKSDSISFFILKFCNTLRELDCIPFFTAIKNRKNGKGKYTYINHVHIKHFRCVRHSNNSSLWQITIKDMSSSIALIKDCSILNHSASILFWNKMLLLFSG